MGILKSNQITLFPCSTFMPKTGISFNCVWSFRFRDQVGLVCTLSIDPLGLVTEGKNCHFSDLRCVRHDLCQLGKWPIKCHEISAQAMTFDLVKWMSSCSDGEVVGGAEPRRRAGRPQGGVLGGAVRESSRWSGDISPLVRKRPDDPTTRCHSSRRPNPSRDFINPFNPAVDPLNRHQKHPQDISPVLLTGNPRNFNCLFGGLRSWFIKHGVYLGDQVIKRED